MPRSFEAEALQQLVDVGQRHQHLARLRALIAADHPVFRELVDDSACARIANVELALDQRNGRGALSGDGTRRARKQWVELALLPTLSVPCGPAAFLEDLFHISRRSLRLPEVDHALHLWVAHEGALDARRFACIDGLVEHVAPAQKLLSARPVEDHTAVDLRSDRKCDARWDVGLDQAGDDVGRWTLRGDDQVDADGARELRDP